MHLVYKSGSVWPAVILHAVNNTSPSILNYFVNRERITGWRADSVADILIRLVPMILIAVFVYIKMDKNSIAQKRY